MSTNPSKIIAAYSVDTDNFKGKSVEELSETPQQLLEFLLCCADKLPSMTGTYRILKNGNCQFSCSQVFPDSAPLSLEDKKRNADLMRFIIETALQVNTIDIKRSLDIHALEGTSAWTFRLGRNSKREYIFAFDNEGTQ